MRNELNKQLWVTSDFPTFSAINCPADNFPAIEEVNIKTNALDKRRLDFIFENSAELQQKLAAFRKGELRVEPNQYFHVCKKIRQEIKYLKDA